MGIILRWFSLAKTIADALGVCFISALAYMILAKVHKNNSLCVLIFKRQNLLGCHVTGIR